MQNKTKAKKDYIIDVPLGSKYPSEISNKIIRVIYKINSKLTVKIPIRGCWYGSWLSLVNFEEAR